MTSIERGSLFAAACLLLGSTAWANPNTLRRGQSVLTVSGASWSFDRFLVGNGDTDKLPVTITQTSFILGFDHGLSDQLQLSVNVPWVSSKRDVVDTVRGGRRVDPGDASTNDGAGDARLSLKYRLTHGTGPQVALYLGAKWPGSYRTRIVPSNQRGRGEVDLINSPGDGNFDLEAGASVGHQWGPFTGSVDLGYRLRQGLPPNEYVLRLEASYLLGARWLLFSSLDYIDAQGGTAPDLVKGDPYDPFRDFVGLEEDVTRPALGVLLSFNERTSAFVYAASTVDGKNTAKGVEYGLGVSLSFQPEP